MEERSKGGLSAKTLGGQVGGFSLVLIVLILVVAWMGMDLGHRANTAAQNMFDRSLVPAEVLGDIKSATYRIRGDVLEHILASESEDMNSLESEIQNQRERINAKLRELEAVGLEGDEAATIERFEDRLDRYLAIVSEQILPASRAGADDTAKALATGSSLEPFREARTAMNSLVDNRVERAHSRFEAAQATYESSVSWMTGIIVFAVLLAGSLGTVFMKRTSRAVARIKQALSRVASGDLSVEADDTGSDEFSEIASALNTSIQTQRKLITEAKQASDKLEEYAEAIRSSSRKAQETSTQTDQELDQIATAMNEMAATIQQVAESANEAFEKAKDGAEVAGDGRRKVTRMLDRFEQLSGHLNVTAEQVSEVKQRSESIANVLEVINGIAEQTNLLALNAAIEAARAGETGRGFAVVADEVRSLSLKTHESTDEIRRTIDNLKMSVEASTEAMAEAVAKKLEVDEEARRTGDAFENLLAAVSGIQDMNTQIATASDQQACVSEEMNRNVTNVKHSASISLDATTQTQQIAERLLQTSQALSTSVGVFRF